MHALPLYPRPLQMGHLLQLMSLRGHVLTQSPRLHQGPAGVGHPVGLDRRVVTCVPIAVSCRQPHCPETLGAPPCLPPPPALPTPGLTVPIVVPFPDQHRVGVTRQAALRAGLEIHILGSSVSSHGWRADFLSLSNVPLPGRAQFIYPPPTQGHLGCFQVWHL